MTTFNRKTLKFALTLPTTLLLGLGAPAMATTSNDAPAPVETPAVTTDSPATATAPTTRSITFKIGDQKPFTRVLTATTPAEALALAGVKLGPHDLLSPSPVAATTSFSQVTVTRVAYSKKVKISKIKHKVKRVKTNKLYVGQTKVKIKGKNGKRKTIYKVKHVNGKKVATTKVKTTIYKKSRTRVVLVGAKARPAISGVWKKLAQCESGGNPRIVSSNGLYHGLFQFSVGTWHSVGGEGTPSQATPAEQLKRAKILQARSGWRQWPHCSSKLGLR